MPGQFRIRIRYRDLRTPWFDHLTVSRAEMAALLHGTGWRIERLEPGPAGRYSALLLKGAGVEDGPERRGRVRSHG